MLKTSKVQIFAGLKPYKKMIIFMAIPFSVMLSMFALRFLHVNSSKEGSYFKSNAVPVPDKELEDKNQTRSNLEVANDEISNRRYKQKPSSSKPKLIHLSFEETAAALRTDNAPFGRVSQSMQSSQSGQIRLPGILARGAATLSHHLAGGKAGFGEGINSKRLAGNAMATIPSINFRTSLQTLSRSSANTEASVFNGYSDQGTKQKSEQLPGESIVVQAMVLGDQSMHDGSQVRFRTTRDFTFRNQIVNRNTLFTGYATFENQQVLFTVNRLGEGPGSVRVNMHCRNEPDAGLPMHEKSTILKNSLSDVRTAAVDEVASSVPIGSGLISRAGRSLFPSTRQRTASVSDGQEVEFELEAN